MKLGELKALLRGEPEFARLGEWRITRMKNGGTSPNRLRLRRGRRDYFVKEISPQERKILPVLAAIKSPLAPPVVCPNLLARDILVSPYLGRCVPPGGWLEPRLFREYARMQNTLNTPAVQQRLKRSHGFGWEDDGYYRKNVGVEVVKPMRPVRRAKRKFGWPVYDLWLEALASLKGMEQRIQRAYTGMPFARLHYDFREDNVVGHPQRLTDWGSSYGHGMFMYDVAVHIGGHAEARDAFVVTSDICRRASRRDVDRWLWLASSIRLMEKAWHTDPRQGWMKTYSRRAIFRELDRFTWLPRLVLDGPGRMV